MIFQEFYKKNYPNYKNMEGDEEVEGESESEDTTQKQVGHLVVAHLGTYLPTYLHRYLGTYLW
jgi:hypothetical protein